MAADKSRVFAQKFGQYRPEVRHVHLLLPYILKSADAMIFPPAKGVLRKGDSPNGWARIETVLHAPRRGQTSAGAEYKVDLTHVNKLKPRFAKVGHSR